MTREIKNRETQLGDNIKKIISSEEIKKILYGYEATKGTTEYQKYLMCEEFKYKKNNKWTSWKYMGWSIPTRKLQYFLKTYKDKMYLVSEEYYDECGTPTIERYEVTDVVKQLLGLNKITVDNIIESNAPDIIVKVCGRNPANDCDSLIETYYHGKLNLIPKYLRNQEVLGTGYLLGLDCFCITIPFIKKNE